MLGPWLAIAAVLVYRWWLLRQIAKRQAVTTRAYTDAAARVIEWERAEYEARRP
jgi:hypothetical protein